MIGIVLATHGKMAEGVTDAVNMIIGKQEAFAALGFMEGETTETFYEKIKNIIDTVDQGEGVIIFTDLFGATPMNVCGKFLVEKNIYLVSGVNLSMILEICMERMQEDISVDKLCELAVERGISGISDVKKVMNLQ